MSHLRCFFLLLVASLLFGCSNLSTSQRSVLDQAYEQYRTIEKGLTLKQVSERLGAQPLSSSEAEAVWETKVSDKNFVQLQVWLGADGLIAKTEVTRSRGYASEHFRATSNITR